MDLREITEFLKDTFNIILSVGILIFVFMFIAAFQPIAGNSMSPTVKDSQISVVSRSCYLFKDVERGDIVTFNIDGRNYVKRVIALPGETVHYLNGYLYINNEAYKESYLPEGAFTSNFMFIDICKKEDCPNGVIPEDKYFVMGDNRIDSLDSRDPSIGLVDKIEIKGRLIFTIWPINEIGRIN